MNIPSIFKQYPIFNRREANVDVEVAASGYVRILEEELEAFPEEGSETNPENLNGSEQLISLEAEQVVEDSQEVTQSRAVRPASPVAVTNSSNQPSYYDRMGQEPQTDLARETISDAVYLDSGEDVAELSNMVTDWTGIRITKSHGAASLASMSTIHPDVIKQRVKKTITRQQNAQAVHRIRAKGEASAATRKRRENKDLIRSDGIWGWDN